ncbi:MAG: HD-GYP domain-containing protein [Candidatus Xenobia bacterium]
MSTLVMGGALVLAWLTMHRTQPVEWGFLLPFTAAALYLYTVRVNTGADRDYFFWDVVFFAAVFLARPAVDVAWVLFGAGLLYELYRLGHAIVVLKRSIAFDKVLSNFSNPFLNVLYVPVVVWTHAAVSAGEPLLGGLRNLAAMLAVVAVFLSMATLVDAAYRLVRRELPATFISRIWRHTYAEIVLHLSMLAPLGIVLALLYTHGSWMTLLLVVPVLVVKQAVQARRDVLRDTEVVIEALVGVLEERDQYTYGHSERVSLFAEAIAEEMGLQEEQVSQIRKAGRIHDIGKIDVPDAVLRKPGHLDCHEQVTMRSHTDRNYWYLGKYTRLGRHIPFEMAAYHHERYDGQGYILGLSGEQIPLGSRIISVADTWDAMTSDRPYRKGLPTTEARARLESAAGTQLDPKVVSAMVRLCQNGRIDAINRAWKSRVRQEVKAG